MLCAALILLTAVLPAAAAKPVVVLAAFPVKPALDQIVAAYRQGGGAVMPVYGASPVLAQQIENGLQADLFFSADSMWTDELARHQLIKSETLTDFVGNHLVLIGKKGATPAGAVSGELALVRLIGSGPIAMCDPDGHPAGRMAKASLTTLGVWDSVAAKVARAENPPQAVTMVARGEAPYAIVFATDALTDPGVATLLTFPDDSHPPIRYPVAVLTHSTNPAALEFLTFLKGPSASAIFNRLGYVTPAGK